MSQNDGVPPQAGSGLRPDGLSQSSLSQAKPLVPNAIYAIVDSWRARPATDDELKEFVELVDNNHCKDSSAERYEVKYRVQNFAERHARKLLKRLLPMAERPTPPLSGDVVRLVIAAREVAYGGYFDSGCEHAQFRLRELDRAAEAFASRIAWDEEPASGTEARSGETEGLDPKGDGPTLEEGDAQPSGQSR